MTEGGAPALRLSGGQNGSPAALSDYADYRLRLQYKWAVPRNGNSGVFYHGFGPGDGGWSFLPGVEFGVNIGPEWTPTGTFWTPGVGTSRDPIGDIEVENGAYKRGAPKRSIADTTANSAGAEQKPDQWNTAEILTVGGTAVHVLNGKVVLVVTNLRRKTPTGEVLSPCPKS